jgi:sterol desaturase/sphingolipid hydroxylase (fatty acid hydroxylase superfamily)
LPEASPIVFVACFIGVDFLYYWFHRMSHEVNGFWAAHVVHHQSEQYNLSVALRQGAFQAWFSWMFYLPLALLGFPPLVFLAVSSFNTLYQFWIHTRLIGRLGPLEWVFNTPSHHRVHHARNPKYIDRNHGGTLIVWDRLFGTFKQEEEEPVYGITTPLRSWNPLWANVSHWVWIASMARRARGLGDELRCFVKPPGWRPPEMGGFQPAPEVDAREVVRYETRLPRAHAAYVFAQFVLTLAGAAWLLQRQSQLSQDVLLALAALVVCALLAFGGLFERRRWAVPLEVVRVPATLATIVLLFRS